MKGGRKVKFSQRTCTYVYNRVIVIFSNYFPIFTNSNSFLTTKSKYKIKINKINKIKSSNSISSTIPTNSVHFIPESIKNKFKEEEIKIFELNSKYNTSNNNIKFNVYVSEFIRKLKWRLHYLDKPDNHVTSNSSNPLQIADNNFRIYLKGSANLELTKLNIIDQQFIKNLTSKLENCFNNSSKSFYQPNINMKVLNNLTKIKSNDSEFIVKNSDKNCGLAIMSKDWYHNQLMLHTNTMQLISHDSFVGTTFTIINLMKNFYRKYCNTIKLPNIMTYFKKNLDTITTNSKLNPSKYFQEIVPILYVIPKIHKTPISSRPIVSSSKWINTFCSKILTKLLNKTMKEEDTICSDSASIIRDLNKIKFISNDYVLSTADVDSLYPSINVSHAIPAIINLLKRKNVILNDITESFFRDLFDISFKFSVLRCNNNFYLQTSGISMGSAASVIFANLYLCELEYHMFNNNDFKKDIMLYSRYIDDIFTIAKSNIINSLLHNLNNMHDTIKITSNTGSNINFLDLSVSISDNKIHTCIYQKECNKFLYLNYLSNHNRCIFKSTIMNELNRYICYSSDHHSFLHIKSLFFNRLLNRDYPLTYLNNIFNMFNLKHYKIIRSNFLSTNNINSFNALPVPSSSIINNNKPNVHHLILPINHISSSCKFKNEIKSINEWIDDCYKSKYNYKFSIMTCYKLSSTLQSKLISKNQLSNKDIIIDTVNVNHVTKNQQNILKPKNPFRPPPALKPLV